MSTVVKKVQRIKLVAFTSCFSSSRRVDMCIFLISGWYAKSSVRDP